MSDNARTLLESIKPIMDALHQAACSDHNCIFGHPGGMGTNGGCQCLKNLARGGIGSVTAGRIGTVLVRLRAFLSASGGREEPDVNAARQIAENYEKAPCFAALLGEEDDENPCTCPSCGHRAIIRALRSSPPQEAGEGAKEGR